MILDNAEDIEAVGEAGDGAAAVEVLARTGPDVVLMDVRMPDVDGVEATRRIRAADPDRPRILVLTTFDLDEYVYSALRAGASGFLLKDTLAPDPLSAVRVVAGGGGGGGTGGDPAAAGAVRRHPGRALPGEPPAAPHWTR